MKALVTGITGQDAAYLAQLLLSKGYEVHGGYRRSASENFWRLEELNMRDAYTNMCKLTPHTLRLTPLDVTCSSSVTRVVMEGQYDEIYNLAAQSFVAESFNSPTSTFNINALAPINLLEAIRLHSPRTRFYQASTSEMFGLVNVEAQDESTPFHPRSPYGVAKAAAHYLVQNYREAYGLHASCGILFNHECVTEQTPIIINKNGSIDIVRFPDIVAVLKKGRNVQHYELPDTLIWDGDEWVSIKTITATRRRKDDNEHTIKNIHARAGIISTTNHHTMIKKDNTECKTSDLNDSDELLLSYNMPKNNEWDSISDDMAKFIGYMIADGYINQEGVGQFTKNDNKLRSDVNLLWMQLFGGNSREDSSESGFKEGSIVKRTNLSGNAQALKWLRSEIYTKDGLKKIPKFILNSSKKIQQCFFDSYYACDGLKQGKGYSFKTNSSVLAQGLIYILSCLDRRVSTYLEERNGKEYYAINVFRDSKKGNHLKKNPNEIRKITESKKESEWVFDIETESEKFFAGVGYIITHNSPLRGIEFVTRKITDGVARIVAGKQQKLSLGNTDARRDWGHAKDYVYGMWLMLQQPTPDDYVLSTGQHYAVEDFLRLSFERVGLDYREYLTQDERYMRPSDVPLLCGDYNKAAHVLGWHPVHDFESLVHEMVDADLYRQGIDPVQLQLNIQNSTPLIYNE